jgi:hypothetical protein
VQFPLHAGRQVTPWTIKQLSGSQSSGGLHMVARVSRFLTDHEVIGATPKLVLQPLAFAHCSPEIVLNHDLHQAGIIT